MELPKQINNINERVVDDLKERLSGHSRVSIAAASFSIYAFEALKKELEDVEELRFIFTSPTFVKDKSKKEKREFYIPKLNRERSLYGTDFEIRLRNQLSQKAIAKECAKWIKEKVRFKSNSSHEMMGGFLHLKDDTEHVYFRFYMVYLTDEGEVLCDHLHPKQLLDIMRHACKDKKVHDPQLCAALNKATADGRHMEHYSDLLQDAINSIVSIKEESDIDSLFSVGETTALRGEIKGLDDFELITFLVITELGIRY